MKYGEHIEYYDTGEILYKINYLDGKRDGEYIGYYSSGEISYKMNYIDGKRHGGYIRYFKDGEINYKSYYINDNYVTELVWLSYNRNLTLELLGL